MMTTRPPEPAPGEDVLRLHLERQLVRAAVGRAIFCPHSGELLDCRRAILMTITLGDESITSVMADAFWDLRAAAVTREVEARGGTVEVLDGRQLFARRPGRSATS